MHCLSTAPHCAWRKWLCPHWVVAPCQRDATCVYSLIWIGIGVPSWWQCPADCLIVLLLRMLRTPCVLSTVSTLCVVQELPCTIFVGVLLCMSLQWCAQEQVFLFKCNLGVEVNPANVAGCAIRLFSVPTYATGDDEHRHLTVTHACVHMYSAVHFADKRQHSCSLPAEAADGCMPVRWAV